MDTREEEVSWGEIIECVIKVTKRYRQIVISRIIAIRTNLWQILDVTFIHGPIIIAEDVPEWVEAEQDAGNLIVLERVDMDKLQWLNGRTISIVKSRDLITSVLWGSNWD